MIGRAWLAAAVLIAALGGGRSAVAEPYLAVHAGLKCGACHVNPAGGGMRNAFGSVWALNELSRKVVQADEDRGPWVGEVNQWLAVGGNVRAGLDYVDVPGADEVAEFGISRGNLYGAFRAVPGLVTLYVDEQVAPGGAQAREAYVLLTPANGRYTFKAGKFVLPFGWRLQDDTAFVRQVTGINFDTPDHGVELGLELPRWSAQLAVTNGTAGGGDVDTGKQTSLLASYVRPRWRVGASYHYNNAALGDREMVGVFAGLRTGPVAWLAEIDLVEDATPAGDEERQVSLLEGNWRFRAGHNLKLSYEYFDPDTDRGNDARERYSVVWELSPIQHLQSRVGLRFYNGVPNDSRSNRDEAFVELHAWF